MATFSGVVPQSAALRGTGASTAFYERKGSPLSIEKDSAIVAIAVKHFKEHNVAQERTFHLFALATQMKVFPKELLATDADDFSFIAKTAKIVDTLNKGQPMDAMLSDEQGDTIHGILVEAVKQAQTELKLEASQTNQGSCCVIL